MKKILSIILSLFLLLTPQVALYANETENAEQKKGIESQENQNPSVRYKDALGLTLEQKLEDFDYMWNTLKDSYTFWGVAKRMGIDTSSLYDEYRELIKSDDSDFDYIAAINSPIFRMNNVGHISFIDPEFFNYAQKAYDGVPERTTWAKAYKNEKSIDTYKKLSSIFNDMNEDNQVAGNNESNDNDISNVSCKILVPEKTAYMSIKSFDGFTVEKDKKVINEFYKKISDYDNLIIDLTENSGGSDNYWTSLLVAPNIEKEVTSKTYGLLKESENNKPYINEAFKEDKVLPIDKFEKDKFPNLNKEDFEQFTHYVEMTRTIKPANKEKSFSGEIYILTSERVFSSSEAFVSFCKDTGFATLVGTQTGGDGIGIDPVYVTLPNSGLMVRYSLIYGINNDGSNNQETGTTPDVVSKNNENPIVTCLEYINSK